MRNLTIRTTSLRREENEHEKRKPELPPPAEDPLRGKRIRLSSKHPSFYYYNKSARGKWNRASQVVEGMRWNAYKSSGKETPLPCPLHVPEFAPMMGGRMRELEGEKSPERRETCRKKEKEVRGGIPQASRAEDARAPETHARRDYRGMEAAGDAAGVHKSPEGALIVRPRLEHDLALHEGIQAGRSGGQEAAEGDVHFHAPTPKALAAVETDERPRSNALQLRIAGRTAGGHPPVIPASHVQAEAECRTDQQQSLPASLAPAPSGSAPVASAIHHAQHRIRMREGHAPIGAPVLAGRPPDIIHPAETPLAPAIAVHDARLPRGPGYLSSATKKVVQLKVARADAQPPGDI